MAQTRKNVLLIGGTGFVGGHLARLLADEYQVFAFGREVDVCDIDQLRKMVAQVKPDLVVNLASITTVRESFHDPSGTYDIAFKGMFNLLTALKDSGFIGKVVNVSSSEVYGHPSDKELPINEAAPLRPMSPYSVAKLATEFLCYQWWRSEGTHIVTARPFTHIGPGQSDRFAISNFSRQIAEIKLGIREPVMRVGDLSTTRDFTDVRDTVRAYRVLLESGNAGEAYNVCSGTETSLGDVLDGLIAMAGKPIRVETDTAMLRKVEQQRLRGSYDKLERATQWRPTISLEKTLADTLAGWLNVLKSRPALEVTK